MELPFRFILNFSECRDAKKINSNTLNKENSFIRLLKSCVSTFFLWKWLSFENGPLKRAILAQCVMLCYSNNCCIFFIAADFLMGVYLFILAIHDVMYRGSYNQYSLAWMRSWKCQATGFLAMVASEVSYRINLAINALITVLIIFSKCYLIIW